MILMHRKYVSSGFEEKILVENSQIKLVEPSKLGGSIVKFKDGLEIYVSESIEILYRSLLPKVFLEVELVHMEALIPRRSFTRKVLPIYCSEVVSINSPQSYIWNDSDAPYGTIIEVRAENNEESKFYLCELPIDEICERFSH